MCREEAASAEKEGIKGGGRGACLPDFREGSIGKKPAGGSGGESE